MSDPADGEICVIKFKITGLKPGLHGFHVHEKSDFSNGCASAGPHYNPHGKNHGAPSDEDRHVGDLGNIEAGADGVAEGTIRDHLIKLDGPFSVISRSFMVRPALRGPSPSPHLHLHLPTSPPPHQPGACRSR